MHDHSEDIGMFPLRLFLLPNERTTLHIFEPRYLQLIMECLQSKTPFGIPYQTKTLLSEHGSLVKIVKVEKRYESGEMDVIVECTHNFSLNHFQGKSPDKMYPCGSIKLISDENMHPNGILMMTVKKYLETLFSKPFEEELNEYYSHAKIIKSLSLNDEEKYKFLSYNNDRRNAYLVGKTRFLTLLIEQEKKVVDQFYLN